MAMLTSGFAANRRDDWALIDEFGTTTWAELDERVNRLVNAWRDRGVVNGSTIAVVLGNRREWFEVALGGAHGGVTYVPVNWHFVADELAYLFGDAGAVAVVVDERYAAAVAAALTDERSRSVEVVIGVGSDVPADLRARPGYMAYEELLASGSPEEPSEQRLGGPMFYTSGTTGRPKGVRGALSGGGELTPDIMQLVAAGFGQMMPVPGRTLLCGPFYHSAQWAFSFLPMIGGSSVVMQHTNLHLVPTQMSRLLDLPDERREAFDGGSLRSVLHGAAPCPPSVKRAVIEWWGPVVTEYYGGTEGGFLAVISAEEWLERPGSVGRPLPVVEVRIVGDDGCELAPGETGEIWFRNLLGSDFEYHRAPDKTAAAHREGGFGTLGDVGHLDEDGYLHLSDRKIDMVVSGGVNIYPAEVEGVLAEHPAVADVAVFGIPDDDMGESVHAAVSLRSGRSWDESLRAELDEWCRANLAGFKRPRSYEVHDELPRVEAGKLAKRQLRDPWWVGRDRSI